MEFSARNVNDAISEAFWKLKVVGVEEQTRNGPVLAFPEPVMTIYKKPDERVLFWGERDANPIFHLLEAVWMLSGSQDVMFPSLFNSRISQYSDDGVIFNAAYGYRWRRHFGFDQLLAVINLLKEDPQSRQAVIQIWDTSDLVKTTKDKACNTQVYFEIRQNRLNMTVVNRSNDIWYGCYGANAVHFSVLQEFVARAVGVPLGEYRQFSNNLHLYTELYDAKQHVLFPPDPENYNLYATQGIKPYPLFEHSQYREWLYDAENFVKDPFKYPKDAYAFFREVAYPMAMISHDRKNKIGDGLRWVNNIQADDWLIACLDWIERRESAKTQGEVK